MEVRVGGKPERGVEVVRKREKQGLAWILRPQNRTGLGSGLRETLVFNYCLELVLHAQTHTYLYYQEYVSH